MSAMALITHEIVLTTAVLADSVAAFIRRTRPAIMLEEEVAPGVEVQDSKAVVKAIKVEGEEDALAKPTL